MRKTAEQMRATLREVLEKQKVEDEAMAGPLVDQILGGLEEFASSLRSVNRRPDGSLGVEYRISLDVLFPPTPRGHPFAHMPIVDRQIALLEAAIRELRRLGYDAELGGNQQLAVYLEL